MSSYLSSDEIRERDIALMGAELGELFNLLSNEHTWAVWRWHQHKILFAPDKPARLELLNRAGSFFFFVVQRTLWEDVVLSITRLAGPETTGPKQNLSLRRVPLLAPVELRDQLTPLLGELITSLDWAFDWRNRHIAHRDWDLAVGRSARPLVSGTVDAVDDALRRISGVLNCVQRHYSDSSTLYDGSFAVSDAESMLYVLRDGLRLEDMRSAQLEEGKYDPELWGDRLPPARSQL